MHIVFYSYYPKYNINNALFRDVQSDIGDDLLSPFVSIEDNASKEKIKVSTFDQVEVKNVDAIVFVELPKKNDPYFLATKDLGIPMYLITLESPIIMPENYDVSNHLIFKRVFTWDDRLIDLNDSKYIKINYSFNVARELPVKAKSQKKLLTIIAGNKLSRYPNELYSERVKFIKFMEKYHPDEFDLYGFGWNRFILGQTIPERIINKLKIPRSLFGADYKSYVGSVERKGKVLRNYSFSVCYENVKNIPGYITEKIFDCFFAGCVPIYLGAANIADYVPKNCFIDQRDFKNFEDTYAYIKSMSDIEYLKYIENIQSYLLSEQAKYFSNDYFSNTVLNGILER